MGQQKIVLFTDLHAWKEAHVLVLLVYRVTQSFPRPEMFGLTAQMRRAAISVTSNIAEGFSRNSFRQKAQFYSIALGSLTELQTQLMVARDVEYISVFEYDRLMEKSVTAHKLINGLIKYARHRFARTP